MGAETVFDSRSRAVPLLSTDGDSGQVHQVRLVETDREWGGRMGLSSSSSGSEGDLAPRGRRLAGTDGTKQEVHVVEVGSEWKGLGSGDSESSSSSWGFERVAAAREARRVRLREPRGSAASLAGASSHEVEETPIVVVRRPICPQPVVFAWFSLLHTADFVLRMSCFCVYWYTELRGSFFFLLPLQVFGTYLSVYITFHDADVLLWLHKRSSAMARFFCACAAFAFLGCCQVIQVKRAWSRQLQVAEVLTEMGVGDDYDDRATTPSSLPQFAAADRMMPVALITGVPFLLVNWLWNEQCRFPPHWAVGVIWSTNLVLIATVSLGLIEIDVAISSYVFKRYHYEPERHCFCWKTIFPLVHIAFRAAEVFLRLVVITGFVVGVKRIFGKELMAVPLMVDFTCGVALLVLHSPTKESVWVHLIAGVGLLLADLGHFVDLPNFAAPARRITSSLSLCRFVSFLGLTALYLTMEYFNVTSFNKPVDLDTHCQYITMFGQKYVLIAAAVYYTLRLSPQIRRLGDDLHTAARAGDVGRIRTLLRPDQNGQVLDVNAEARDRKGLTPLMLAAARGHIEVMVELLNAGARVNDPIDIDGNTCLHYAAKGRHTEACRMLIDAGADSQVRNFSGESPGYIVPRRRPPRSDPAYDLLQRLLQPAEAAAEPLQSTSFVSHGRRSSASSVNRSNRPYTVNVAPTAGLQLRTLFPDVEKDDTPSPRVLHSVSALVVSRAAGGLAQRVLARQDDRNSRVPLGALRRVRELGRGGFGRVIEVELPAAQRSSSLWLRASQPRRFALKLQLKQHQCQAASEVLALRRADHPFIVHLERAFAFSRFFALLLELCPTDLNRLLCEADEDGRSLGLRPPVAAKYMGQAGLALAHLHRNEKIVFRDVKPENILISDRDEAKLTDFGLAKVVTSAERMTMCGTMGFLPPELLSNDGSFVVGDAASSACERGSVGGVRRSSGGRPRFNPFKIDTYSFGVTLQVALLGEDGARKRTVHRKGPMMLPLHLTEAENAELLAQLRDNGRLSAEAFALLVEMLLPHNPARRACLTDPEVLNHAFFLTELGCEDLGRHLLPSGANE